MEEYEVFSSEAGSQESHRLGEHAVAIRPRDTDAFTSFRRRTDWQGNVPTSRSVEPERRVRPDQEDSGPREDPQGGEKEASNHQGGDQTREEGSHPYEPGCAESGEPAHEEVLGSPSQGEALEEVTGSTPLYPDVSNGIGV